MVTTLGIDLASKPANTALCVIAWESGNATVLALARSSWNGTPIHDKMLSTAARGLWGLPGDAGWGHDGRPAKVAIDAPFGWPDPFVEALLAHHSLRPWPEILDNPRAPFERRETDRFVRQHTGKQPLSVSTDRIAHPAMRCAVILGDLAEQLAPEPIPRDGRGLVAECYPDAALRLWLPDLWVTAQPDSYKGTTASAHARRRVILEALLDALGPTFDLSTDYRDACVRTDDALICALVARAVDRGVTMPPERAAQRDVAMREGWIHLPQPGSLGGLT